MELTPASVTVISYFPDGKSSLRLYNALPPSRDPFSGGTRCLPVDSRMHDSGRRAMVEP